MNINRIMYVYDIILVGNIRRHLLVAPMVATPEPPLLSGCKNHIVF